MKQRPLVREDIVPRRGIPLRPDPDALIERDVTALIRAAITRAQAYVAKRSRSDELAMARERWGDDPMVPLVLRAATTPTGLPHALGQSIVADLLTVVGATSAGARLLQLGLSLTFGEHATIYVPGLEVTASQTSFSGQMAPIPARQLLTTSVTLAPSKLTSIVPVTVEMLESSNIELIVSNALSRAVGLTLDGALFELSASRFDAPGRPAAQHCRDRCFGESLRPRSDGGRYGGLGRCRRRDRRLDRLHRRARSGGDDQSMGLAGAALSRAVIVGGGRG